MSKLFPKTWWEKLCFIWREICASFCFALVLLMLSGCTTRDNTWRADGFGITLSTASITIIYGEINKVPPGGYFKHTRSVDLRPFWKRWFCDPETNCLATATVVLDSRLVGLPTNTVVIAGVENDEPKEPGEPKSVIVSPIITVEPTIVTTNGYSNGIAPL